MWRHRSNKVFLNYFRTWHDSSYYQKYFNSILIVDLMNIHSILRVQPSIGESSTIYSKPILAFVPSFNVSQNYPVTIGMKEKSSFHVNLTLPLSSFNTAYAKLYMPYNEEHHGEL